MANEERMINPRAITVFWHELGHYFAACYRGAKVVKIELNYSQAHNDYEGMIFFVKPPGHMESDPIKDLPARICGLAYGCFFERLYIKDRDHFDWCFDEKTRSAAGFCDATRAYSLLKDNDYGGKIDAVKERFKNYLKTMEYSDVGIKEIFNERINDLFLYDTNYTIDLDVLKSRFNSYITEHKPHYEAFLQEIRMILRR